MKKLFRIILLPFGLAKKCFDFANEGARDLENKYRFRNTIIDKGCSFNQNTIIHPNVHILENCILNNSEVHSYSYLGKNCLIQNATIGKFCSIANDVSIGLGNHPLDHFSTSPLFYRRQNTFKIKLIENDLQFEEYLPVSIGNDVWIGSRSIILDGIIIGNGSVIAANSVVTKDVAPYSVMGGVPAKLIKYRFSDKKIEELNYGKWWDMDLNKIKSDFKI
jgi:acetyltransferase-like isoleucine patch superfamily enzyme